VTDLIESTHLQELYIPSVTLDDENEYYCTASYGVYVNGTSHIAERKLLCLVCVFVVLIAIL